MTWQPPSDWARFETLETHAAGEPLRIVTKGFPALEGATIPDQRRCARERWDGLRRALMWEPRGHADMYGALILPPATEGADAGVLFMHNEGWSTMCGHGVIALATAVLECELLEPREPDVLKLDTPAGRVIARARRSGGRVAQVSFENVPSFVVELDAEVEVDGLGTVRYDLAYGGAFYAFVDAEELGLELDLRNVARLIDAGTRVKRAVRAARAIEHPEGDAELGFLYGTILVGPPRGEAHSRNVCVFADGEVDRSPTGTGVSARAAIETARGELELGAPIAIESLIGTRFEVRALRRARVGGLDAIVPEVTGSARLIGRSELWLDPRDEVGEGFLVRG